MRDHRSQNKGDKEVGHQPGTFALPRKLCITPAQETKKNGLGSVPTSAGYTPSCISRHTMPHRTAPIPDSEAGACIPFRPTEAPGSSPGIDVAVSLSAMALARATGSSGRTSAIMSKCTNVTGCSGGVRVGQAVLPLRCCGLLPTPTRVCQSSQPLEQFLTLFKSWNHTSQNCETVDVFFSIFYLIHRQDCS